MGTINLVLFEPEIPQNTGNIMRTCIATNTVLHLIEPLGFSLDSKHVKRSGVNYHLNNELTYYVYKNIDEFFEKNPNGKFYFLTRYGHKGLYDVDTSDLNQDYYFILGKESTGIPYEILKANLDKCIRLPMTNKTRSLNLSNCAAIIVYEALRQQGFPGLETEEPEIFKGKNFLTKDS
ncbi:MAG TPA: tRNA (cytidine(34)-2'-O)-methyltransferase [Acholeplasmataceae bacterium]|jgi:tRNA (cytidine/uridine-2'-O-)-methyltransferase|nr:tRNA (cytidine(34)-2'-O)-methyltransferase [Acholeplasmataceae bacterium]